MAMAIDIYDELPPSPTLTNPDMILPSRPGDGFLVMSAHNVVANPTGFDRNPGYSQFDVQRGYQTDSRSLRLADLSKFHAAPVSPAQTSPSLHVRQSSPLEAIDETETTPTRSLYSAANPLIPSSPTLRMLREDTATPEWPLKNTRRLSGLSNTSSACSDELERWAANKATMAAEDPTDADEPAPTQDEEDDAFEQQERQEDLEADTENTAWLNKRDSADDDFLSRRAEVILANAKKRLNMMEGNLKGARYSLTSNTSNRFSFASSRARQSIIAKGMTTPGHSRAASEVSLPSSIPALPVLRPQNSLPKRSSSALGSFAMLDRTPSLRGYRSQEAMRESRLKNWIMNNDTPPSPVDAPRAMSSIEYRSSMINGSPTPSESRPSSQASSIRAQMSELKDRISEIKGRAVEINKRAGSLGLRTPSPYGSESRHTESYRSPPRSVDTLKNANIDGSHPEENHRYSEATNYYSSRTLTDAEGKPEYEESYYEDAEETLDDLEEALQIGDSNGLEMNPPQTANPMVDDIEEEDEVEEYDGASTSGATEYYDTETVLAERHEDRADAFDYENFFLHSAMGSYSRQMRRDSYGSESSVETTRPASPLRASTRQRGISSPSEPESLATTSSLDSLQERNMSVSSIATFRTAVEGGSDDEDDTLGSSADSDVDPNYDSRRNSLLQGMRPPSKLSNGNPRMSLSLSSPPPTYLPSPPTGNSRPSSVLLSSFIGLDSVMVSPETIQQDRALVENVVSGLQKFCLELQRAPTEKREVLREKLLEARRILLDGLETSETREVSF